MKNIILYLLLIIAVPAAAQPRHHRVRPRYLPHPTEHHHDQHHQQLGMNPRDYDAAVTMIRKENFDEKRLDGAKRIIAFNPMDVRQIAGICRLFTFEANRLEFAKYAYRYCVDPNNYFLLDEVFTFGSSKEDLHRFIRR